MKVSTSWQLLPHAEQRARERRISQAELALILYDPEFVIEQGAKKILGRSFVQRSDNALAAVILKNEVEGVWLVITVMVNFVKRR